MMTANDFVKKYYPFALRIESETSIPAIAIMAQAALESAWGKKAIGNNLFGIKFKKGDFNYQKVLTTEYSKSPDMFKGEDVSSKTFDKEKGLFKYKVWQYFADYETPYEAFLSHSKLLLSKRYKHCLKWNYSPNRYLIAVWRAGYATDPNYGIKMCQMTKSIKKRL